MAYIKRNGARKEIAGPATPFAGARYENGGVCFDMQIGLVRVTITHYERDMLISKWSELEKEWEK